MRPESVFAALKNQGARFAGDDVSAEVTDYGDPAAELDAIWNGAGLRDQSGKALLLARGEDRVEFVNGQCTNDVKSVNPEHSITAAVTTPKGRVIDHVQVFARHEELGIIPSSGAGQALGDELNKKIVMEKCELTLSSVGNFLAVGPNAGAAVRAVFGSCPEPKDAGFQCIHTSVDGGEVTLLGSKAPGGFGIQITGAEEAAASLCAKLVEAGLRPVGETAYQQARIESGLPQLDREMGDHTNPLEAGLTDSVSFTKGCYVGQEVVARLQNYRKVKRQLIGIRLPLDAPLADLDEVFWDLLRVGNVTSAVRSERLGATVALALIKSDYSKPGTELYCVKDSHRIEGEAVELPFQPA